MKSAKQEDVEKKMNRYLYILNTLNYLVAFLTGLIIDSTFDINAFDNLTLTSLTTLTTLIKLISILFVFMFTYIMFRLILDKIISRFNPKLAERFRYLKFY